MIRKQNVTKPQTVHHDLNRTLRERYELRKVCGPYIGTPHNASDDERSFYLDSDFMPSLRWQWCDDVAANITHTGWFCDEYQDDKIRGIVLRLPQERGFLAGWSMGEGLVSGLDTTIHECEIQAAYCADSMAESIAERNREYLETLETEDE